MDNTTSEQPAAGPVGLLKECAEALAWCLDVLNMTDDELKKVAPESWLGICDRSDRIAKQKAAAALGRTREWLGAAAVESEGAPAERGTRSLERVVSLAARWRFAAQGHEAAGNLVAAGSLRSAANELMHAAGLETHDGLPEWIRAGSEANAETQRSSGEGDAR